MPDDKKVDDAQEAKKKSAQEATDDGSDEFDADRAKEKINRANREAKALRDRLEEAEKRLKDADEADKSELQKLTDRVTAAEARAQEAEARALRAEIAAEKGLTASQAKRLVGSNRDELEADADELLEAFGSKNGDKKDAGDKKVEGRRSTPKEDLRPGASRGDEEPEEISAKDAEEIADRITKANRI